MRVYCGEQCDWVLLSALSTVFIADWKALLISLSLMQMGVGFLTATILLLLLLGNLETLL